jgi:hypothetical protein
VAALSSAPSTSGAPPVTSRSTASRLSARGAEPAQHRPDDAAKWNGSSLSNRRKWAPAAVPMAAAAHQSHAFGQSRKPDGRGRGVQAT